MPRQATKRNASQRQPAFESTSIPSTSQSNSSPSPLPTNFTPAPKALTTTLLSHLPTQPIYLIHTDTTSPITKRRTFLVPVYLNLFICSLLALRLYYAAPSYLAIFVGLFDPTRLSPTGKDPSTLIQTLLGTTISRFALFVLDYAIFVVLGSWPWEFVRGNKYNGYVGPLGWRRELGEGGLPGWGFLEREVVVRRSKGLHLNIGDAVRESADRTGSGGGGGAGGLREATPTPAQGTQSGNGKWNLDDELKLKAAILPALEERRLREKTGYLLVDREWDLDFRAMNWAHGKIEAGVLDWEDVTAPAAYAWYGGRWICWRMGDDGSVGDDEVVDGTIVTAGADRLLKANGKVNGNIRGANTANTTSPNKTNDESTRKLDRFRKTMDDRGCEDVFFRWIEIVQFESSGPGGLTEGGRGRALMELKGLLQEKGVDLTEVLEVIGGVKELPGMEED